MRERILKVTTAPIGEPWSYEDKNGVTFFRNPSLDDKTAMGEDEEMFAVYQHDNVFSTRLSKKEW